jgi:hypothetical protein
MMFDKYPDVPAIARACKSVAIKLDEQVGEMMKAKADQAKINENLRRSAATTPSGCNLAPALRCASRWRTCSRWPRRCT